MKTKILKFGLTVLMSFAAIPVFAQLSFTMPEMTGVVQQVSIEPPVLVIDSKRYVVSPKAVITADGYDGSLRFAQVSGVALGRQVGFDGDERVINRLHVFEANEVTADSASNGKGKGR
ncbi:MAG: hypothetical protein CVU19_04990 [Betaproteobacteria bacterium HGW-Betaproteobacteria-13]|jgi:hypothetical protein|nr:MAG: hypothetical protein CVU19_04990 [Betaproteobacteria bacterium HGW-Betaproteobacteria-13]